MEDKERRIYTADDMIKLEWHEFDVAVDSIYAQLNDYLMQKHLKIDFIVPVMRGGAVLAVTLAHKLNVVPIFPCQYKYEYVEGKYTTSLMLSTIDKIEDKNCKSVVLVTEGNHVTGATSQKCIDHILSLLPNATILYASVGRDYAHLKPLRNTEKEYYGFLTNESEILSISECNELNVKSKFVLYPWEILEEELYEINQHYDDE